MRIRQAKVLRQQKYFVHFPRNEIETLRAFLGFEQAEPAPRGIVYLSRKNEVSEVANRVYPNEIIETIVEARGGRIIRTAGAPLEEYGLAASDAETVIFDHGSAIYNSLRWRPIRVVEIVSDAWWNNAFLMFADAMGVTDYTIIRGDLGDEHVARLLNETLDRPVGS
jgi:capsular polysaccharide biosynthesis protein